MSSEAQTVKIPQHNRPDGTWCPFSGCDSISGICRMCAPERAPADYRSLQPGDEFATRPDGPARIVTRVEVLVSGAAMVWHETPDMPAGSTDRFTLMTPGVQAYGAYPAGEHLHRASRSA